MDMENFEKLRPVGRMERYSTSRHDLRFYLGPAVTASYKLPQKCSLPLKDYVYQACEDVIAQHPILSAIPVDEQTQSPHFIRLPKVDLDKCVTLTSRKHKFPWGTEARDAELEELLSSQHSIPYEAPNSFWRLCILSNTDHFAAAFFYHHALGDGRSGMAFHRTFQQALSRAITANNGSSVQALVPSPTTPLLPTIESLHPLPLTIWHIIKVLFKQKVWSWRDSGLWTGAKCAVPLGQTQVRNVAFPASATITFKNLCRDNGTTITAALQTLIAGVLFSHLPSNYTSLNCSGALSMRQWLPPDAGITDDVMGVWIQELSETYNRTSFPADANSKTDPNLLPWPEAQRSRRTIEHSLSLKGTNSVIGLLRYVNNYHEELFLPKIGKERSSSFEVSNLGLFKPATATIGDEDNAEIGRMMFTQSAGVMSAAIQFSVVTGADGCLVLGVTWQEGIVEEVLVEKVTESVRAEIGRLTGTN
ncbi:Alcohol acetyltransferase [Cladophialophora chaetospira]|uniref:Alcohol acetyltransferase n=1 Tax=Cladophialophora chaetospira TaxID=386627 RepID=A0AA39CND7_9EURO|nr:Alcohol acetyltransferase [Cladophialophora chaetospira]